MPRPAYRVYVRECDANYDGYGCSDEVLVAQLAGSATKHVIAHYHVTAVDGDGASSGARVSVSDPTHWCWPSHRLSP